MEPNKNLTEFIHPFVHLSSPPYFHHSLSLAPSILRQHELVWRFYGQHWKLRPPYEQPTQSYLHRRQISGKYLRLSKP
ncbi:hypothetical protein HanRHA438_Chr02g0052261 [Helianthus annuus]|nr:hypothetical protein HanIR_Chr02g0057081 [Helianthus annuus]KAJ0938661.1 hypothetical protein HanRHA438_Chr02g0052261 [Helianthus annuus]